MKLNEIKTFETGSHCFGPILEINEKSVYEFEENKLKELLIDLIKKTELKNTSEVFELITELLYMHEGDEIHNYESYCEQCGDYNESAKFKFLQE